MNGVVKAVGLQLGEASGGILALDFDGHGAGHFQHLTGHDVKDLPKTIAFDSADLADISVCFVSPKSTGTGLRRTRWM